MKKLLFLNIFLLGTLSLVAGEVVERTRVERAREEVGKIDERIEAKRKEIERDREARDEFKEQKDNEALREMLGRKIEQTQIIITEGSPAEQSTATKEQSAARSEQKQVQERIEKMQEKIIESGKDIDVGTAVEQTERSIGSRLTKQLTIWKEQIQARLYDLIGKPEKARALRDHVQTLRDQMYKPRPQGALAEHVSTVMLRIDRNIDALNGYVRSLQDIDRQTAKKVAQAGDDQEARAAIEEAAEQQRQKLFERDNMHGIAADILEESFVLRDELDALPRLSVEDKTILQGMDKALTDIMLMLDASVGVHPNSPAEKTAVKKAQQDFVDTFLKQRSDQFVQALVGKLAGSAEKPGLIVQDPIHAATAPEYKQLREMVHSLESLDITVLDPEKASLVTAIVHTAYKGLADAYQQYMQKNRQQFAKLPVQERTNLIRQRNEIIRSRTQAERRFQKALEREQEMPAYEKVTQTPAYKSVVAENSKAKTVPKPTLDSSVQNTQVAKDTIVKNLDTVNTPASAKAIEQNSIALDQQAEKVVQQIVTADPSQSSLQAVDQIMNAYDQVLAKTDSVAQEARALSDNAITTVATTMARAQEALPVLQDVANQVRNDLVQVVGDEVVQLPQITKTNADTMSSQETPPAPPERSDLLAQIRAGKALKRVDPSEINLSKQKSPDLATTIADAVKARRPSIDEESEEESEWEYEEEE